jgi:hypothetical protein
MRDHHTIRAITAEGARRFLEIRRAAVRRIAARDCSTSAIEAGRRRLPTTDRRFLANRDGEVRLIAESDGEPVAIGAIVVIRREAE